MSKDSIDSLRETMLFKKLVEKEDSMHNGDHEISTNVILVVTDITPLLEKISDNLPEFTLHDSNHSRKIVELMGLIIPSDTLQNLNIVEISILIYSAYLHDIGMAASPDERKKIIDESSSYNKFLLSNTELINEFEKSEDYDNSKFIEDRFFTEFLRINHVERTRDIIQKKYGFEQSQISWQGTRYYKWVQLVCDSHGLPVKKLKDTARWPRDALVKNQKVNVQYLSLILRLADILDLDPERTPKSLFDFINPKDEISIQEWKKHRSIIGWDISSEIINFEAECTHPTCERAIRKFIDVIEEERMESVLLTSSYKDDLSNIYRIDLSTPVTNERISSNGDYIYSDFRFDIDYRRVLDLLMGERMYGNPILALREILQNSVDAIRYREAFECVENNFSPLIKIELNNDELIIEDNGIGMDEIIFQKYFMQIGKSYYDSSECRENGVSIDSISEFGIGILSVFMVSSKLKIESRRMPSNPLKPPAPIHVEVPTAYNYFVRRPSNRYEIGTKITFNLKSNHPFSSSLLIDILPELSPFIEYAVKITTEKGVQQYNPIIPGNYFKKNNNKIIFKVLFDDCNEGILKDVEGAVDILMRDQLYFKYDRHGIIAQRGFAIRKFNLEEGNGYNSYSNFPINLSPQWVNIRPSINLSGEAKLNLTPDRTDVINDEKYDQLRNSICAKVLEEFKNHLNAFRDSNDFDDYIKYVNNLIEHKALETEFHYGLEMPIQVKNFFLEYVPFNFINKNGEIECNILNSLDDFKHILITSTCDWPSNITSLDIITEIKDVYGEDSLILLRNNSIDAQKVSTIYEIANKDLGIYMTSFPGIVCDVIPYNSTSRNMDFALFDSSIILKNEKNTYFPIFVHSPAPCEMDSIILNMGHPFLELILKYTNKDNADLHFPVESLRDSINTILCKTLNIPKFLVASLDDLNTIPNPNFQLVGVFEQNPDLLEELKQALHTFCENCYEAGIIPSEIIFPEVTKKDFPWFWDTKLDN